MNKILSMCGLESNPRWIDLSDDEYKNNYMCSLCGEKNYETVPPEICPNCKSLMKKISYLKI